MQDGVIRVNRQKPNFHDLSDYWMLTMHDNQNGVIHALDVSFDKRYLLSVGADGNIFIYKWSTPGRASFNRPIPVDIPSESIEDIRDASELSLEQQKQKDNQDRRSAIANKRKENVRRTIAKYREEFLEIMDRNNRIIESQRVQQSEIRLDDRITQQLEENFQQQYDLMKRKLAFDLEKSRLLARKVKQYFIEPLDHLVIHVFGIRWVNMLMRWWICVKFFFFKETVGVKVISGESPGSRVPNTNWTCRANDSDRDGIAAVIDTKLYFKSILFRILVNLMLSMDSRYNDNLLAMCYK